MACVVCYQETAHSVAPCGHRICAHCAGRWFVRTLRCPYCRGAVLELLPRRGARRRCALSSFASKTTTFARGGRGVQVEASTRCASLRRGDVVCEVNGVPVEAPETMLGLVRHLHAAGVPIECTVVSTSRGARCCSCCLPVT